MLRRKIKNTNIVWRMTTVNPPRRYDRMEN